MSDHPVMGGNGLSRLGGNLGYRVDPTNCAMFHSWRHRNDLIKARKDHVGRSAFILT